MKELIFWVTVVVVSKWSLFNYFVIFVDLSVLLLQIVAMVKGDDNDKRFISGSQSLCVMWI